MGIRILAYHQASELSQLLLDFLASGESVRFIVPSRKDREWLLRRSGLRQYGPLQGPPDILWIWQDLYDDIARTLGAFRRRPISPPDHLLILRSILADALGEEPQLQEDWPGLARSGFLEILSDDVHELMNEAVRPEDMPEGGGPVADLLRKIYARYLTYLHDNRLLDSSEIWTAAAELTGTNPGEDRPSWGQGLTLVFTGFLSFTHGQIELLKALETLTSEVVILKPEAGLKNFHDAAEQFALSTWAQSSEDPGGQILEIPVDEPDLEPETIARALALWPSDLGPLAEVMPFPGFAAIGIMAPGDSAEATAAALSRFRVPFRQGVGVTIDQTLPGHILSFLRELHMTGFPTRDTILLLMQPCFAGAEFPRAEALRLGPVGIAGWKKQLGKLRGSGELSPEALAAVQTAQTAMRAIEKFLAAIEGPEDTENTENTNTPADLMTAFHDFLTTRGLWLDRMATTDCPELDEGIRVIASAIDTVEEKALSLRELLPDIGVIARRPLAGAEAFEFLETWCRESSTRPPLPLSGAVSLYSAQPPVLASCPVWIMSGVVQRAWPGQNSLSPLLGAAERQRLGEGGAHLPSPQDKVVQREALFRRLIRTGEELTVISRPLTDDSGRPLAPSPFVERFLRDAKGLWERTTLPSARIDSICGDGYAFPDIDPAPDSKRHAERTCPVITDVLPTEELSLGVSSLQDILLCPMRWWLTRRAQLPEHRTELAGADEWGNLLHAIWANVWSAFAVDKSASISELTLREWEQFTAAEGIYEEESFRRLAEDVRLARRREALRYRVLRLGDLQERIAARIQAGGFQYEALRLEKEADFSLELEGVTFRGRFDRLTTLRGPDGRRWAVITDYKSGKSAKYDQSLTRLEAYPWNSDGRGKFHWGLQLSAYALLFRRGQSEEGVTLGGVCFLGHEDGKLTGTFAPELAPLFPEGAEKQKRKKGDDGTLSPLQQRMDEAEYAMKCAADILKAGSFPPFCDGRSLSAPCRYCGLAGICRKYEQHGDSPLFDDTEDYAEQD